ncbi:hypothetical protein NPIL_291981 [Nephila pilipes]|uniref:Uncharacterized protein n=1 Tax=Nephila pilipes TaxID=299642 RepID=A0A8X6N928_NEPPI|nr:hypothetical protein NPIL_291981 [Nephila pilipes]
MKLSGIGILIRKSSSFIRSCQGSREPTTNSGRKFLLKSIEFCLNRSHSEAAQELFGKTRIWRSLKSGPWRTLVCGELSPIAAPRTLCEQCERWFRTTVSWKYRFQVKVQINWVAVIWNRSSGQHTVQRLRFLACQEGLMSSPAEKPLGNLQPQIFTSDSAPWIPDGRSGGRSSIMDPTSGKPILLPKFRFADCHVPRVHKR